ncbi:unnamed protein product [Rotaria sp. Silwood1]|nr:unnamed protein product [Rotaria sp. Silwood1]
MNISVFGIGYVGCVSLGCLAADGHNIIGVDSNHSKVDLINSGKPTVIEKNIDEKILAGVSEKRIIAVEDFFYAVKETEISIICVGTPIGKDGKLDLSHVFKVAEQIGDALKFKNTFHIISVRSSIPPDTKLNISENYLKPGFAYGGSCLPKDLKALESMAEELNIKTPLISGISKSNETHIELAFHLVKSIKKKNVGIAGITFKEGTDDKM